MDYVVNRVDHYRVRHHGTSAYGPQDLKAWLSLYGSGHVTGVVGAIGFYRPEALESRQDWIDPLGRPQGHMPIDELPELPSVVATMVNPSNVVSEVMSTAATAGPLPDPRIRDVYTEASRSSKSVV